MADTRRERKQPKEDKRFVGPDKGRYKYNRERLPRLGSGFEVCWFSENKRTPRERCLSAQEARGGARSRRPPRGLSTSAAPSRPSLASSVR